MHLLLPLLEINLAGQWQTLWGPLSKTGITGVLSFVAFVVALIAIVKYFMARAKGGGADSRGLLWTGIFCLILAAPQILVPILLTMLDWILNFALNVFGSLT